MSERHALILESLRDEILEHLVSVRSGIDSAYAAIPDDVIRAQFDVIVRKMASYLMTEDVALYRSFARRWVAMRTGEGFAPENLIHSAVAIVDVAQRVAQQRMRASPEYPEFARALGRLSFTVARLLVELLAEELAERSRQLREVRDSQETQV